MNSDLIYEIIVNRLAPAKEAIRFSPNRIGLGELIGNPITLMRALSGEASRRDLENLVEVICLIEQLAENFLSTAPERLITAYGEEYRRLFLTCYDALSNFDQSLIRDRYKMWREARPHPR